MESAEIFGVAGAESPAPRADLPAAQGRVFPHAHWMSLKKRIVRAKTNAAKLALARQYVQDAVSGPRINFCIAAIYVGVKSFPGTRIIPRFW